MSSEAIPKVSVLMSVFNTADYVRESIESILDQSFSNFEFLIFDDGSTDGTAEIIREYEGKDNRIKAFYKEENEGFPGMIKNLNKGLEIARGEYVARMDGDDISLPQRLNKQVEYLDAHPGIFLAGTGAVNIDAVGNTLSVFDPITSAERLAQRLVKVPAIYNPSVMFRKRPKLRYFPVKTCEDYYLFLSALKRGLKLTNLPDHLIKYRVLPPSLSHGDPFLRSMHTAAVQDLYSGDLREEQFGPTVIEKRYHPKNASKQVLFRMIEVAQLGRKYDVLFDLVSIYRKRFGINIMVEVWALISRSKLLLTGRL